MSATGLEAALDRDPYVAHHPFGRPFWRAAASGRLLVPRCAACGRAHWYPRPFCPFCASPGVRWEAASGNGRVYACSALRRAATADIVAYVRLDEGPVMMTNLIDCSLAEVRIDDRVRVRFRPAEEGRLVPVFAPARQTGGSQQELS